MKMPRRGLVVLGAIVMLATTLSTARADLELIFDNYTSDDIVSGSRSPDKSPFESFGSQIRIEGTEDVTINGMAVFNLLQAAGSMRFLIFDHPSHDLLFESDAVAFDSELGGDPSWKMSPEFTFVLEAGKTYDVGAIADVGANWWLDNTSHTENSITSVLGLPNFKDDQDSNGPYVLNHISTKDGAVRLFANVVPEPATLLLWGAMGLVGLAIGWRRHRVTDQN
jgi:hypothetical protein